MIEEKYVSFELAKILKSCGFFEGIEMFYDEDGDFLSNRKCSVIDGKRCCSLNIDKENYLAPTRSPWSRNLCDPSGGLYWQIKPYIGENETLYGENLYGEHSIHYDKLQAYWHLFGINDGERWYGWDEVKEFSKII